MAELRTADGDIYSVPDWVLEDPAPFIRYGNWNPTWKVRPLPESGAVEFMDGRLCVVGDSGKVYHRDGLGWVEASP
jgi:hypothetical protein